MSAASSTAEEGSTAEEDSLEDRFFADEAQSGKVRIDRPDAPTGDASAEGGDEISGPHLKPPPLASGTLIANRYLLEGRLGLGGHGAVHRALHLALDMPVAVKVLALGALTPAEQEHLARRFSREARTLARIRHRNVLAVHDTGVLPDGSPYLVSELVEGEDLEQRIARARLPIPAVVDLGRQLFAALTALAEAGVLHRDVKPANVMLRRESDERVHLKLIDFGIARGPDEGVRLTVAGQILGTPHYMAPEQLRGETLDVRVDLYAACAVLYEALTCEPPFDGATTPVIIGKILGAKLVSIRDLRPDCPEELATLIERGLSKRRVDRPPHPLAVVAELDRLSRRLGLPAGALAWADDPSPVHTQPVGPAARTKTPPDGTPRAPDEQPMPLEPEHEHDDPSTPEVPGHIEDPPPRHFPTPGAAAFGGTFVLVIVLVMSLSLLGSAPRVASAPPATTAAVAPPPPIEVVPDVGPLLDRGLEALALGEIETALASYRAACAADPERPEGHRGRALAAARAGLTDEAISSFERYLSLAPDAPDAERVRSRLHALRDQRAAQR